MWTGKARGGPSTGREARGRTARRCPGQGPWREGPEDRDTPLGNLGPEKSGRTSGGGGVKQGSDATCGNRYRKVRAFASALIPPPKGPYDHPDRLGFHYWCAGP